MDTRWKKLERPSKINLGENHRKGDRTKKKKEEMNGEDL